jgi:regulator of RNase E activity RraA
MTDLHEDALKQLGTSTISDALDRLGLAGAVPGIVPLDNAFAVCGRAFTVSYEPTDDRPGTVGDFLDDVDDGSVVAIDNRGRLDCTVWGDIMTSMAHRKALGGTVIDGVCRDISRSLELGYPVFSRGRNMQTGKDRVRLRQVQGPIQLGRVSVEPGDYVVGDADGVVVVPTRVVAQVIEVALTIEAAEDRIREAVAAGQRLDQARRQNGYHALQTPVTRDSSR